MRQLFVGLMKSSCFSGAFLIQQAALCKAVHLPSVDRQAELPSDSHPDSLACAALLSRHPVGLSMSRPSASRKRAVQVDTSTMPCFPSSVTTPLPPFQRATLRPRCMAISTSSGNFLFFFRLNSIPVLPVTVTHPIHTSRVTPCRQIHSHNPRPLPPLYRKRIA